MYLSVLVPLDRSSFAEQALPLALSIARRANARLDLVEVHALYALEGPTAGWLPFEPDRDAECKQQEQLYLDATAKWVTSVSPVSVTAGVLSGSAVLPEMVADSILERARTGRADLIVMATHGRGPLSRFGVGSVADELIRRACLPVLLVRPAEKAPGVIPEPVLDNILIPLDGSALAEQVLEPGLDLARLMEARCTLLRVVESRSVPADRAPGGSPDRAQTEAEAYLERVAGRVRAQAKRMKDDERLEGQFAKVIKQAAADDDVFLKNFDFKSGLPPMPVLPLFNMQDYYMVLGIKEFLKRSGNECDDLGKLVKNKSLRSDLETIAEAASELRKIIASSAESVGDLRFRKLSKSMI
jgi:nucleotide-binding universal stress UspA family protein